MDSDNGSEFINFHLLSWCDKHQITFTRSRVRNKNYGCHVEQKNWSSVRTLVGYHRYDTPAEVALLNKIWALHSQLSNYFYPPTKTRSQSPRRHKNHQEHDTATTLHRRAHAHPNLPTTAKADLSRTDLAINPAALQRQTQALLSELLTLTITKAGPQPSNSRGHLAYEATTTFAGITT
ncbi:transposase [Mycobacterium gordonae]|uniref:Transposase n=1 Tax=Mycobacterium gordonae TaxID=1778 RepID=A0A1X1W1C3_MYCGO|nr:transposase [Mycobacterium gordonae]ORV79597.1 transposase [Mycobacterium gordonae]